jgi:hypothetical protein
VCAGSKKLSLCLILLNNESNPTHGTHTGAGAGRARRAFGLCDPRWFVRMTSTTGSPNIQFRLPRQMPTQAALDWLITGRAVCSLPQILHARWSIPSTTSQAYNPSGQTTTHWTCVPTAMNISVEQERRQAGRETERGRMIPSPRLDWEKISNR